MYEYTVFYFRRNNLFFKPKVKSDEDEGQETLPGLFFSVDLFLKLIYLFYFNRINRSPRLS